MYETWPILLMSIVATLGAAPGEAPSVGVTESKLVERLDKFERSYRRQVPLEIRLLLDSDLLHDALDAAGELLDRFPKSGHRQRAYLIKLEALVDLARTESGYLGELLAVTIAVAGEHPSEPLASENAFCAIQAFVMGARLEGMEESRRLLGSIERYEAFLRDHPKSARGPVVFASLVRCLIATARIDDARSVFARLEQAYPDHTATRRAEGELYLATAIGRPFHLDAKTPDGKHIRSVDYRGKPLVVHFWASWSRRSISGLEVVRRVRDAVPDAGVAWLGINLDFGEKKARGALEAAKLGWPQCSDYRALEGDLALQFGITKLPTYIVVGADGTIRALPTADRLEEAVRRLLSKSGHP